MADGVDIVSDLQAGGDVGIAGGAMPAGAVPVGPADAAPAGTVRAGEQPGTVVAPADEKTAKEPSVRERLTTAFRGPDGQPATQADAVTNTGQPRQADGKFAAKVDGQQPATPAEGQQQQAAPAIAQPPRGMSHDDFQTFSRLPAEMQQYVARTMEGLETRAARVQAYENLDTRLIGPRREAWAINGMSEEQALTQLFALSDFASQRPVDFVQWFAGTQGINLAALAAGGQQQQQVDPVTADLQRRVHELQQQLGGFTNERQQQAQGQIVSQIQAFAEEKGTDGTPVRPYFQELGQTIYPFVQSVKEQFPTWTHTQILQEAYDRACWATPAIRERLQTAESAKRLTEQAGRTAAARHAGSSVTGAPVGAAAANAPQHDGTVRGMLKDAFAAARTEV